MSYHSKTIHKCRNLDSDQRRHILFNWCCACARATACAQGLLGSKIVIQSSQPPLFYILQPSTSKATVPWIWLDIHHACLSRLSVQKVNREGPSHRCTSPYFEILVVCAVSDCFSPFQGPFIPIIFLHSCILNLGNLVPLQDNKQETLQEPNISDWSAVIVPKQPKATCQFFLISLIEARSWNTYASIKASGLPISGICTNGVE